MISKNTLVVALAALPLACGIARASSPLIPLTQDGSSAIFFVADATVAYNDNLYFQKDKTDDVIFSIAPGFELVAGGDGNSKFNLKFQETLQAYVDNDNLNAQLANVDATYTYDAQQSFKGSVSGGFHQTSQATNQTVVAGDIVQTDTFYGKANGEYKLTEKTKLTAGVGYNGIRYTNYQNIYNDQDTGSIPVSWLYAVTDKLDAGLTYQYSYTSISTNDSQVGAGFKDGNQQVHFVGLTANGAITEKFKLTANAGIGYSQLESVVVSQDKEEDTTFNFSLVSTYAVTEKLTASLTGAREFSVGATGQQITTTRGVLGASYAINEAWSANANAGYMLQEFTGAGAGDDNIITAGFGVSYQLNKFVKFGVNYAFFTDDTDRPGAQDFNNNTVSFTASVKY